MDKTLDKTEQNYRIFDSKIIVDFSTLWKTDPLMSFFVAFVWLTSPLC